MAQERCTECGWSNADAQPLARLVLRALGTSAVVGTVLVFVNQGQSLMSGAFPSSFAWRLPLTYFVPFCVSLYSAFTERERRGGRAPLEERPGDRGPGRR